MVAHAPEAADGNDPGAGERGDRDPLRQAVPGSILLRRVQRLRIDVEGGRVRGAELEGGERENSRSAAEVEHALAPFDRAVQPLEAERRGRMRSGPEGEAGIEVEDDGPGIAAELLPRVTPLMEYMHNRYLRFYIEQDVVGHLQLGLAQQVARLGDVLQQIHGFGSMEKRVKRGRSSGHGSVMIGGRRL